eukprot:6469149-Amphidinium_carterae.2
MQQQQPSLPSTPPNPTLSNQATTTLKTLKTYRNQQRCVHCSGGGRDDFSMWGHTPLQKEHADHDRRLRM